MSQELSRKIAIIGYPKVGKTTLTNLIRSEEIHIKRNPKINADIATLKIGKFYFYIHDYIGKEQFSFLWEQFIKDSDLVLLVSDSTSENVKENEFFIEIIKKKTPDASAIVIANKQDLDDVMEPSQIEKILGLRTYPIVAIDSTYQQKITQIIIDLLSLSDEISQYSSLIIEKENWERELEAARNDDNNLKAFYITKKLIEISESLGDDILRNEYHELGQKLHDIVNKEFKTKQTSLSKEVAEIKEPKFQKISQIVKLLKALITNYMNEIKTIMAVVIFDRSGSIIASESKIKTGDNLEIEASVIKMPEIFGINQELEKKPIRVTCPTCKANKNIFVPKSIVKEAENVVTFSIPNNLVCKHQFQIFVDKDFAIRGYQRVDYEIDSYMDRILKEVGIENEFFNITVTRDKKIAYCSKGPNSIVTSIAEPSTSDVALKVYSEYIAAKVKLILEGIENVDIEIPLLIKTMSKTKGGELPIGNFSAKIIITGNYQVGKTSLVNRFVRNLFRESYQSTIGVDLSEKLVEISEKTKIKFLIWDIGGQITQIAPYRKKFYEGANSAFIVLDRTRPETLKSVELWYNDIKKNVHNDISTIILGNKSDLSDEIKISEEDIKSLAEQFGFHYILTSAKTGENVNDAFLYIAYKFLESI